MPDDYQNPIAVKVSKEEDALKDQEETIPNKADVSFAIPILSRRQFSRLVAAAAGTLAVKGPASISAEEVGVPELSDTLAPSVEYSVGPYWPHELGDVRAVVSVPVKGRFVSIFLGEGETPTRKRRRSSYETPRPATSLKMLR
jgi:hypothetical protein